MKTRLISVLLLAIVVLISGSAAAQTTTLDSVFTYQGYLTDAVGNPIGSLCDLRFVLHSAAAGSTQIGSPQQFSNVTVDNGVFSVQLDFGNSAFDGSDRYLEIGVRCPAGTGTFNTLTPRQAVTPAPYAVYATNAGDATRALGGPFWNLNGNSATAANEFLGTLDNKSFDIRVNNLRVMRYRPETTSPVLIGGFNGNTISTGVQGAVIAGGGLASFTNTITDNFGVISGGAFNRAGDGGAVFDSAPYATVGGGYQNAAENPYATIGGGFQNDTDAAYTTIAGGRLNEASDPNATVGGGQGNVASGENAVVSGGYNNNITGANSNIAGGYENQISGDFSTIVGGEQNTISGDYSTIIGPNLSVVSGNYSVAIGGLVNVTHNGAVLISDSSSIILPFESAASFEVALRGTGGVRLRTNQTASTGCNLAANSGTWACTSDRNSKENFADVDPEYVLTQVAQMPISTWEFIGTDTRHIGPVAQDFYAAFGLGEGDTTISSVDIDGVSLAAIQGLYHRVTTLQAENDALKQQLDDFEARLNALETAVPAPIEAGIGSPWLLLGALMVGGVLWNRRQEKRA
ncbi:MAG: tail fiber domain-containing protein [Anaerolineae bacterium]|nr:tail fiber domain-containing protein [Anaerolineae bacterium]